MGRASRTHAQMIKEGKLKPMRELRAEEEGQRHPWVTCFKCNTQMPLYVAEEHLKKCQPNGFPCAKCKALIMPEQAVDHLQKCVGPAPMETKATDKPVGEYIAQEKAAATEGEKGY